MVEETHVNSIFVINDSVQIILDMNVNMFVCAPEVYKSVEALG